jgi:hypothetical protein
VSRNEPLPLPPSRLYRPGFWLPGPFYLVPPNKIAFAFLVAPGLILYDLYELELDPEAISISDILPISDSLLMGLAFVALLLALVEPSPVGEAAVLPFVREVMKIVMKPAA